MLKKYNVLMLVTLIIFLLCQNLLAQDELYKDDEVIIKFKTKDLLKIEEFEKVHGFSNLRKVESLNIYLEQIPYRESVEEVIEKLKNNPLIEYIEPNYFVELFMQCNNLTCVPNDPYYIYEWHLNNIGGVGRIPDSDIDGPEGWFLINGKELAEIVIAVIDTGLDFNHEDLQGILWINEDEIPNDGKDNDGNGYIDDINGWDFGDNDNNPAYVNSHGTNVTGNISAVIDNLKGVSGIAPNVKIMVIKMYDKNGQGTAMTMVESINYAVKNGTDIMNISSGMKMYSQAVYDALKLANQAQIPCFTAAGNDNRDIASYEYGLCPQDFDLPNVITVAATDAKDDKASFSNYGIAVDVSAPGTDIWTTEPNQLYYAVNGTSFASPITAGIAGLVWGYYPQETIWEMLGRVIYAVDPLKLSNAKYIGKMGTGRVNLEHALSVIPIPYFVYKNSKIIDNDCAICNKNGTIDPGETVTLNIILENRWKKSNSATANLQITDSRFTVIKGSDTKLSIDSYKTGEFSFQISLSSGTPLSEFKGKISISGTPTFSQEISFTVINDVIKYLQSQINNAAEGTTVEIPQGTYTGVLQVKSKKNITIRGVGRTLSVLQGHTNISDEKVISIEDSTGINVENMTIKYGSIGLSCLRSDINVNGINFVDYVDRGFLGYYGCKFKAYNNHFIGKGVGVSVYDATQGKETHHNIFSGGSYGMALYSDGGQIYNNTFYYNTYYSILLSLQSDDKTALNSIISNNIFYQKNSGAIQLFDISHSDLSQPKEIIFYNTFYREDLKPSALIDMLPTGFIGNGNISVNPNFVDPSISDFHLKENSYSIDAGDPALKDPDKSIIDQGRYGGTDEATKFYNAKIPVITVWQDTLPAVKGGEEVVLNENGETFESYSWYQLFGTYAPLSDPKVKSPKFTAPVLSYDETLTFQLIVTQNGLPSRPKTVKVPVLKSKRVCGIIEENANYSFPILLFLYLLLIKIRKQHIKESY